MCRIRIVNQNYCGWVLPFSDFQNLLLKVKWADLSPFWLSSYAIAESLMALEMHKDAIIYTLGCIGMPGHTLDSKSNNI